MRETVSRSTPTHEQLPASSLCPLSLSADTHKEPDVDNLGTFLCMDHPSSHTVLMVRRGHLFVQCTR
jgi:hypothetical protein